VVTATRAGQIDVELVPPPRCRGCDGACLWYRVPAPLQSTFAHATGLAVGTVVTVTLPDRFLLLAALLLYGVPLAMLLLGAVVGAAALGSDLGAAAGAAFAVLGALLAAPLLRGRIERAAVEQLQVRALRS